MRVGIAVPVNRAVRGLTCDVVGIAPSERRGCCDTRDDSERGDCGNQSVGTEHKVPPSSVGCLDGATRGAGGTLADQEPGSPSVVAGSLPLLLEVAVVDQRSAPQVI